MPIQGKFKELSKKNFEKLKNSISKNGFIQPFFIWENENKKYILDGHQRQKAIVDLYGDIFVSCIVIDAKNLQEAKKLVLFYSSQYGEFSKESFIDFGSDLQFPDIEDFSFPGFSFNADDFLNVGNQDKDDEIPQVAQNEMGVQLGDVYTLGDHRLMCGDSTSIHAVDKLMAGEIPNIMMTDPPYGVNLDQSWRDNALGSKALGKGNKNKVSNDEKSDWTDAWIHFQGNVAYIWHAAKYTDVVMKSLRNVDLEPSQQIIWNKSIMVMGRSDYHFKHEPCWYAIRKGKNHDWIGDRKQTTVIDAAPPNHIMAGSKEEKTLHPTQKPIACMELISNNSGDVYDPFGGSGTTLIACEKTKRKCYMMELDPHYCSVIIKRWEKYTGQKAVKCE